jgi:hypothetical protein
MRLIVEASPADSSPSFDQAGCDNSDQTMPLALFIQRMIARQGTGGAARITSAKDASPAPTELSRSVAPVTPASRLVAFDLTSLRHLRDCRKIAVLAPARLRHDLAALDAACARRMTALAELQDGLRSCTSAIVFDPGHAARLIALGAPRIDLARLPALMPLQDLAPTIDLLLIDHEGEAGAAMCHDLASALNQALPDLVIGQARTEGASGLSARIHIRVGTPAGTAAAIRVIDSHAMNRPVIRFARPSDGTDPAMWVEPMRTGLCAGTIEATIDALRWLNAHQVFIEVFRGHAARAVETFNGAVKAKLRGALMPGDPA